MLCSREYYRGPNPTIKQCIPPVIMLSEYVTWQRTLCTCILWYFQLQNATLKHSIIFVDCWFTYPTSNGIDYTKQISVLLTIKYQKTHSSMAPCTKDRKIAFTQENSAIYKIMHCYLGPIIVIHFLSTCDCLGFYTWIHRSLRVKFCT